MEEEFEEFEELIKEFFSKRFLSLAEEIPGVKSLDGPTGICFYSTCTYDDDNESLNDLEYLDSGDK